MQRPQQIVSSSDIHNMVAKTNEQGKTIKLKARLRSSARHLKKESESSSPSDETPSSPTKQQRRKKNYTLRKHKELGNFLFSSKGDMNLDDISVASGVSGFHHSQNISFGELNLDDLLFNTTEGPHNNQRSSSSLSYDGEWDTVRETIKEAVHEHKEQLVDLRKKSHVLSEKLMVCQEQSCIPARTDLWSQRIKCCMEKVTELEEKVEKMKILLLWTKKGPIDAKITVDKLYSWLSQIERGEF